jgi:ABC-2 type transport system permease protein
MLIGLISTNDVIYFIVIVYIFLGLTIYKLQSGRETKPWYINGGRYLAIVVSALFIGYIFSRPALIGYLDTTTNQDNTLTPNAQQIIKQMGDDKLEITAYGNFLDSYYFFQQPEERNNYLARWEPYLRFKPDIDFNFVSYYDIPLASGYDVLASYPGKTMEQIMQQRAKASAVSVDAFETPEQIKKEIDLKPEFNRFVMKLTYKGKSTFLRVFNDQAIWPAEAEVSAAFKRLLQAKMPEIAFVTGDGERRTTKKGDREYKTATDEKTFRYALINQGFDVDTLSLDAQNIPDNITALVLADPQKELSATAIQKIKTYINKGGNLFIAGEPGRQQITNPLLKNLGVQLMNGMLKEESEDHAPTLVLTNFTKNAISLSKILDKPSIDTLPISMNGASALIYHDTSGFNAQPLLVTKAGAAHNTMARNPDLDMVNNKDASDEGSNGGGSFMSGGMGMRAIKMPDRNGQNSGAKKIVKKSADNNEPKEAFTTVLGLTRQINGKQQRIIISGDADFMSNAELTRYEPKTANFYFSTALFNWLDYGQFPINTARPDAKDNRVTVSTEHVAFLKFVYIWLLPGLILVFAAIFLIRRKRK